MPECPKCKGTGQVPDNLLVRLRKMYGGQDQATVAKACSMTQSAYSRMEKRWPNIPWQRRRPLEEFFKITRGQLMGTEPLHAKPRPKRPAPARSVKRSKSKRAAVAKKNRRR